MLPLLVSDRSRPHIPHWAVEIADMNGHVMYTCDHCEVR